jgi:LacI family transcriptional regulator
MKPTINDVAREAGVSRGTVDRVINKKGNVSKKSEEKVRDAIKKLNYVRSPFASALAKRSNRIKIGIIYPDLDYFFWNEVDRGIDEMKEVIQAKGVEVVKVKTRSYDYREQMELMDNLVQDGVRGIITIANHRNKLDEKIEELYEKGIPLVTVVSDAPNSKRLCYVGINDYKAGSTAAKLMALYLGKKGRLAVIGVHKSLASMEDRINGFKDKLVSEYPAMDIVKIYSLKEDSISGMEVYNESIRKIMDEIMDKNSEIDGVYVTNSMIGYVGVVLDEMEYEKKVVLIGHENTIRIREMLRKGIIHATVFQNQKEEMERAVNILWKYIVGNEEIELTGAYSEQRILIKEQIE